jgi:hypothetical protein
MENLSVAQGISILIFLSAVAGLFILKRKKAKA